MTTFAQGLAATVREFAAIRGPKPALVRGLCALRALAHPGLMREMSAQGYLRQLERKRGLAGLPWDPFHFISHRGYLVGGYTQAQRFRAALHHYRFEAETFDEAFLAALYAPRAATPVSDSGATLYAPQGLTLWSAEVDGHAFTMTLGLSGEEELEGDLCVRLFTDQRCVGTTNFIWADAAMFGRASAPTLFITRCQTHTWPEIQVFRSCFKQNSPPYFALAALAEIARACGMNELYAVHALSQLHYEPQYASSFQNSYDEFWEKFSAERVRPEAFRLPLPLALRDLSELKSKHRSRAEGRRKAWGEVGQAAGAVVVRHLRAGSPNAAPASPDRIAQSIPASRHGSGFAGPSAEGPEGHAVDPGGSRG